jgi:hypothetical protein
VLHDIESGDVYPVRPDADGVIRIWEPPAAPEVES